MSVDNHDPERFSCPTDRAILEALAVGSLAWQSPQELATELDLDLDAVTDRLAELDLDGWLAVWERPEGLVVTLSAWGADRLGLRLVEVPERLDYRWIDSKLFDGLRGRTRARAAEPSRDDPLVALLDPSPPPGWGLDAFEKPAGFRPESDRSLRRRRPDGFPCPSRLIGQGLTPWPGPRDPDPSWDRRQGKPPTCPACGDRPLSTREYCLRCDRWGLDDQDSSSRRPNSDPIRKSHRPAVEKVTDDSAQSARRRRRERRKCRVFARPVRRASAA